MRTTSLKPNLRIFGAAASLGLLSLSTPVAASVITGGDAVDLGSADSVLDIVFTIDTSGSMGDDINAIGSVASNVITNLNCPDIDVYVRARFMGITGTRGIFNETVSAYVSGLGETPVSNSSEDNGPAVTDISNHYEWHQGIGDLTGKDLYRAVVAIGDEGTENGQPVTQADWDAAVAANSAAIANDVFLFSWVTDDPFTNVIPLFEKMAIGGDPVSGFTGSGFTGADCQDTGGTYVQQGSGDSAAVSTALQDIICTAGGGGTGGTTPVPGTTALLGGSLLGWLALRRRRHTRA